MEFGPLTVVCLLSGTSLLGSRASDVGIPFISIKRKKSLSIGLSTDMLLSGFLLNNDTCE